MNNEANQFDFRSFPLTQYNVKNVQNLEHEYAQSYNDLMNNYRYAMMEIETKLNVLNVELSLKYDRNPIESIKTRLKSPESILEKLNRRGYPITIRSIEENLNDIAGVRVICSVSLDIYQLADALISQDDVRLIARNDYIANPMPNGYRGLHLIVEIPIFLHDQKKLMKVEVQFRTTFMDLWANLEYKIRYKKDIPSMECIDKKLFECAELSANFDKQIEYLQKLSAQSQENCTVPLSEG